VQGAILAGCPSCRHQWLMWVAAGVEPGFARCKSVNQWDTAAAAAAAAIHHIFISWISTVFGILFLLEQFPQTVATFRERRLTDARKSRKKPRPVFLQRNSFSLWLSTVLNERMWHCGGQYSDPPTYFQGIKSSISPRIYAPDYTLTFCRHSFKHSVTTLLTWCADAKWRRDTGCHQTPDPRGIALCISWAYGILKHLRYQCTLLEPVQTGREHIHLNKSRNNETSTQ